MPILKSMTRSIRVLIPVTASALAAGCSADVARFDVSSGFSQNESQTNSIPIPPASVYSPAPRAGLLGDGDGASHQPPTADNGSRGGDVRVAELPPTNNAYDQGSRSYDRGYQPSAARSYDRGADQGYNNVTSKPYDAAPRARGNADPRIETATYGKADGDAVEVKQGDTLYSLARKHNVPVNEIMSANDLKGHSLKPGQRLTMPSGKGGRHVGSDSVAMATPASLAPQQAVASPAPASVAEAAPAVADGTPGTYTMKPGDSLYTIARQHKVNYAELQRANGITDDSVRKIRPGTVLKIPAGSEPQATRASTSVSLSKTGTHIPVPSDSAPAAAAMPVAESVTSAPAATELPKVDATAAADGPKVLNGAAPADAAAVPAQADQKVAALDTKTATDATPVLDSKAGDQDKSASGSSRLRWPVQGRIISTFGPRPDGTHNDGVNFSVPQGTDVHAAEGGEVIYVGDELKAYGKLVLLRHDNGWVTAYAHNEDLLVARGKKVARGDVIAKAGKTGPVDQPQVHFELRQDSKAVDPTSFMEKQ